MDYQESPVNLNHRIRHYGIVVEKKLLVSIHRIFEMKCHLLE